MTPGWMTEGELKWLAQQAARCRSIVEVGSYQGRSTKVLARCCQGVVYAVDDFRDVVEDAKRSGKLIPPTPDLEGKFKANLADELDAGKVTLVKSDSITAAQMAWPTIDLVFIDGSHAYPAPKFDIVAWKQHARRLAGHDYHDPGVKQSIEELGLAVSNPVDNIWEAV